MIINDNIVNAETPNYKAKYVTFEEALDASIRTTLHSAIDHDSAPLPMCPRRRICVWTITAST